MAKKTVKAAGGGMILGPGRPRRQKTQNAPAPAVVKPTKMGAYRKGGMVKGKC